MVAVYPAEDHAALAFGVGYRIHASRDRPLAVATTLQTQTAARTVCGSDVLPYLVTMIDPSTGEPHGSLLLSWPPPPENRCTDCERILGRRPRRPRHGWGTWDRLVDSVPRTPDSVTPTDSGGEAEVNAG